MKSVILIEGRNDFRDLTPREIAGSPTACGMATSSLSAISACAAKSR
jgi:5S rRNA maturation endonuclease (ribonuclease M5)